VKNRATGRSMGEHCEDMAKAWKIAREAQDSLAFASTNAREGAGAASSTIS